MRILSIIFFLTQSLAIYASDVIQNTEFRQWYLYNCSSNEEIKICYPERDDNPNEIIEKGLGENLDLSPDGICSRYCYFPRR